MRIAFFGTPDAALPALRELVDADDVDIVRVVTNPDRPKGRGHKLQPPPVKVAAVESGLEVWQPDRPKDIAEELQSLRLDACVIVAFGAILPRPVLAAGGAGFVNLHFSLLPAWRGAAPVAHAIRSGDEQTGVTCFVLDDGMDTGPVLNQVTTQIRPGETAGQLTARLAQLGAPALVAAVRGLVRGEIEPRPQPSEGVSYAPKIAPEDAELDWSHTSERLDRTVRAFNPVPGGHTTFGGKRLKVHQAHAVEGSGPPGAVLRVDDHSGQGGPVVATGDGGLRLDEVQPEGKPRMSGIAFANGYRPVGVHLGSGADS